MLAQNNSMDRKPAVAGRFYKGSKITLEMELKLLLESSENKPLDDVYGLIVPHAGYVFSGDIAATAYTKIPRDKKYKTIFILASSHVMKFNGASVYSVGDYITPLGKVPIDKEIISDLIDSNLFVRFNANVHRTEHSIEVQLPFLQYWLKNDFKIVPIVIGSANPSLCKGLAESLKKYYTKDNLFIVSTDFSHYPSYEDAVKIDKITADAIVSGDTGKLIKTLGDNMNLNIPNLSTSLCGAAAVLTFMHLVDTDDKYHLIKYANSGDSRIYGDTNSVVGYYSIVVNRNLKPFALSAEDTKSLLLIARNAIKTYAENGQVLKIDVDKQSESLLKEFGAFVSLYKDDKLRGCIGNFGASLPLCKQIRDMAISASFKDSRFDPVLLNELKDLHIEISVLSPMKKIKSIEEIVLGKHGIYIKKGNASGTFLPQVVDKTKWTVEGFFGHCARDKAKIGWSGWRDAELFSYEAFVFKE